MLQNFSVALLVVVFQFVASLQIVVDVFLATQLLGLIAVGNTSREGSLHRESALVNRVMVSRSQCLSLNSHTANRDILLFRLIAGNWDVFINFLPDVKFPNCCFRINFKDRSCTVARVVLSLQVCILLVTTHRNRTVLLRIRQVVQEGIAIAKYTNVNTPPSKHCRCS